MQQGTYRFDRMQQVLTSAIIRVWSSLSLSQSALTSWSIALVAECSPPLVVYQ